MEDIKAQIARVISKIHPQTVCIIDKLEKKWIGTGFLVAPDLILTAGHCVYDEKFYCYTQNEKLVIKKFGDYHEMLQKNNFEYTPDLPEDLDDDFITSEDLNGGLAAIFFYDSPGDLHSLESIALTVVCAQHDDLVDFCLLRLASPVENITPIPIIHNTKPTDDLILIHHPGGEPKQICVPKRMTFGELNEFKLAYVTDKTAIGSSGAGVFNIDGELLGIHIERPLIKEDDYEDLSPEEVQAMYKKYDFRDKPLGATLISQIIGAQTPAARQFSEVLFPSKPAVKQKIAHLLRTPSSESLGYIKGSVSLPEPDQVTNPFSSIMK